MAKKVKKDNLVEKEEVEKEDREQKQKKIQKKRKPITALDIKYDFKSFYTGGDIQLIFEYNILICLCNGMIVLRDISNSVNLLQIDYQDEEILTFDHIFKQTKKIVLLYTYTKEGHLRQTLINI